MLNIRCGRRPTGWHQILIGGGGFLVGTDLASDGFAVARTDTYGAWARDFGASSWRQLVTSTSIPNPVHNWAVGVYEIRIAPSNSAILYMHYQGYVYKSSDRGLTWALTNYSRTDVYGSGGSSYANDDFKTHGAKMAINPSDPNHVIVGFPGLACRQTFDGGTSWSDLPTVATASETSSGYRILFRSSSEILVLSAGTGVYRSTNTGGAFSITSSGPTDFHNWQAATDGVVYVADGDTNNFWKLSGTTWSNPSITTAGAGWHVMMTDPADAAHVIGIDWGGGLSRSTDSGSNWTSLYDAGNRESSNDVPWLEVTDETYMASGNGFINALDGKMEIGEGIGYWTADKPTTYPQTITWNAMSKGIEQLVVNDIVPLPAGGAAIACWDRPLFKSANPAIYPSSHGPSYNDAIQMGWALASCASSPNTLVAICNWLTDESGISTDGGLTWTPFATTPIDTVGGGYLGGAIAASTPLNIVWAMGHNGLLYYTTNGGASWGASTIDTGATTGWTVGHVFHHYTICADPVTAGKFYAFNYDAGASKAGIYVSTDGGANFSRVFTGLLDSFSEGHAKLRAVPGRSGHLVYLSGEQDDPETGTHPSASTELYLSTDAGVTWGAVPNTKEPRNVGFGAPATPGGYPTVYLEGWVSNVYGIWRSGDFDQATPTWTQLGPYALDSLDNITAISGDSVTYGRCYVGFGGSGAAAYYP